MTDVDADPPSFTRREALAGLGLAAAWFGRAAAQGAPAHAATLTIGADRPGLPTNPRLLGTNTPWVYGSDHLVGDDGRWNPALIARAREWSPPILRYPALPDTHRWRQGIGPIAARPPVVAYDGEPPQKIVFGTQEFLETCETLQAEPMIQVNVHDGETEALARQAADWVAYLKRQPLKSRVTGRPLSTGHLWELGNEPYVMDSKLAGGKPNPLFLRPDAFVRRINAVLAAMRAVDPTLRAGLPFALDTYSGRPWQPNGETATVVGEQLGFANKVLGGLDRPQDIGFLSLHYYMPLCWTPYDIDDATRLPDDEALYWGAMGGTQTLLDHVDRVRMYWRTHPATARVPVPPFMVTEYNAFFTNARRHGKEVPQNAYVMTLAGALFMADLVMMLATQPQVEAAMQWSLNGNWVFGAISKDADARARPGFEVLMLLRRLLAGGGRLVELQVDGEATARADRRVGFAAPVARLPLVSALATRHGRQLRVLVVNKDPAREASLDLRLAGAAVTRASVDGFTAAARFAAPDTRDAAIPAHPAATIAADGHAVRASLAPASLGLFTLDLAA